MASALQLVEAGQGGEGGLGHWVQAFEQQGLGSVMASWVGDGPKQAITSDQLVAVFGQERLQALAQPLGMSPQDLAGQLSGLLPHLVDHLSPAGALPGAQELASAVQGLRQWALGGSAS